MGRWFGYFVLVVAIGVMLGGIAFGQGIGIHNPSLVITEGSESCGVPKLVFNTEDFDGLCTNGQFELTLGGQVSELGDCIGTTAAEFCVTEIHTGAVDMGSATLEIPNATTLPGTCTIGEVFSDSDAGVPDGLQWCSAANTWSPAGGDLVSAGIAGGQTWNGGTASSDDVTINANTAAFDVTNTGRVNFGERFSLLDGVTAETVSATAAAIMTMSGQTFTMDNGLSTTKFIDVTSTFRYTTNPAFAVPPTGIDFRPTLEGATVGGASIASLPVYRAAVQYVADNVDFTVTSGGNASFLENPDFSINASGTYNAASVHRGFHFLPRVDSAATFSGEMVAYGGGRGDTGTITQYTFLQLANLSNITTILFAENLDPDAATHHAGEAVFNDTGAPDAGAALEVGGTDGGVLLPRVTVAQRDAFAASPDGLIVQNTDDDVVQGRTDSQWARLSPMPKCIAIESVTASENILFYKSLGGATRIHEVNCIVENATSATISIEECDANGDTCAASVTSTACAVTSTAVTVTDAVVDDNDWLRIKTSATVASPGTLTVCVQFY